MCPRVPQSRNADWPEEFAQNSKFKNIRPPAMTFSLPYYLYLYILSAKLSLFNLHSFGYKNVSLSQVLPPTIPRLPQGSGSENWDTVISIVNKDMVVINNHQFKYKCSTLINFIVIKYP